jgi:molecular chaperone HtpG
VDRSFQVDLRGMVDLLSRHLYSSPRVYLRELLQNAVDAVTARRAADPDAPAVVEITADGQRLEMTDTGIGLTAEQVHELLATIGRSSKRDDLGFARHEFLGQFGIGLLAAFLVADEVRVDTRSATGGPATTWTGRADGTYTVEAGTRAEPGTTVTLAARPGSASWFDAGTVAELAALFGSMLPVDVTVNGKGVTEPLPWAADDRAAGQRRADLVGYAQDQLGFTPFDVVELEVPLAGLTGVAYVLPFPVNPAERAGHRLYLKRMLLGEHVDGLLPEWAFFARCVVDATELRPTAGRESLYDDEQLDQVRCALGEQLRGWLAALERTDPQRLRRFLDIHHLGVKALAVHDDEMLALVDQWWPLETNVGRHTAAELRQRYGIVRYTSSVEEYRQLAGVAAAQDLVVVNGGYAYDEQILDRIGATVPGARTERMDPSVLATRFGAPEPAEELAARPFLRIARDTVERLGCEVLLRAYEPETVPVLYLLDRAAGLQQELRASKAAADELWAGVLSVFEKPHADRPQLVFNLRSPVVRRLAATTDAELVRLAVQALYGQALLYGGHPVRAGDAALLDSAFLGLIERALERGGAA